MENTIINGTDFITMDKVLGEIFEKSNLTPTLKTQKGRWKNGKLGFGAKCQIIESNSDYTCFGFCRVVEDKEVI